ncbi:FAD-dependent oxidoreductase [Arthrobacter sp. NPDC089319]|uniref:FAD-dependent oxidoreductase n=1 Tax=Arthrobacter sp. NPDC089319 TaxID=3155915 RepID=UPI003436D92F
MTYVSVRTLPAVRKRPRQTPEKITAEVCVVGAGMAGIAAALTLAEQGRDVVLADALPILGGQAVHSLIGLFCGVFGSGPDYPLLTQTIFAEMFSDLEGTDALSFRYGDTLSVQYDEVVVGRWLERKIQSSGVRLALNAVAHDVDVVDGRLQSVDFASRYGDLQVSAAGFVDATGDATLTWLAGFGCHLPDREIYGSQQFRMTGIAASGAPSREDVSAALRAHGDRYGLRRREGIPFYFPDTDHAVINMTHVPSPLNVAAVGTSYLEGKDEADRVAQFLRDTFPEAFSGARIATYGLPGRRQTRWIEAQHSLTSQEVVKGVRFADAVARTAWPIELHDRADSHRWEVFEPGHVHYVPLGCMIPRGAENLIAAGRCVDGDPAALSSIRVLGPCAAMGAGAAHALDLTLGNSINSINLRELAARVQDNVGSRPA